MSTYSFNKDFPPQWDAFCQSNDALFHSREWQALLENSFGCQSLYAWNTEAESGAAISLFKAGPFKIGYLGFPVGGMIGSSRFDTESLLAWRTATDSELPTCIRIAASAFEDPVDLPLPYESNPETAIRDLKSWSLPSVSENRRRGVKKAKRLQLTTDSPTDASEGRTLYRIYSETVKNHGGALRYNADYFSALINLAGLRSDLQVRIARHDGNVAGFVVVAIHGTTAFYLHGGTATLYRQYCPSDLLLNEAIHMAQGKDIECFNFMSSPNNQASLVKYKQQWGGETRQHKTYTLAIRSSYHLLKLAEKLYHLIR